MPRNNRPSLIARQPATSVQNSRNRIRLLKVVALVALSLILVRLFVIQIIEHEGWLARAEEQHTLLETITAKRGEIYFMDNNEPVAAVLNQTTYQVVIDPTVTDKADIQFVLETYAKDYVVADLEEVYATEGLRYAIVAKDLPRSVAEQISASQVPAVWLKKTNMRVYPEGDLGSVFLGFVNLDGVGQYGVEGALNSLLAGKDGLIKTTADINKVALSIGDDNTKIPAEDGVNIVLSIDRGLEKGVEEIALEVIDSTVATNASALVMDTSSGEVIAMANLPNYDPANYGDVSDASAYINYVTEVPYEPASVCKSFSFSAAINEGVMTSSTSYFNQGYEIVDDWKIKNAIQRESLYGTIDMKTALSWSLNTGSMYALKLLGGDPNQINQQGREKLYDYYYNKFRLGQATGIELAEAEGFIPDPNEGWGRDSVYANMTFGQNLNITMIQTAAAFSAVVNGGVYRTPTIVKGVLENGEVVPRHLMEKPKISDQILTSETSAMMREMLINNRKSKVLKGIDRPGYAIGGKTGTAQVIKDGAYDDTMNETVGTYIGFVGPSEELPKYVIMVKMWGEGQHLDGEMAVDFFDSLANYLIDYLKIKPKG